MPLKSTHNYIENYLEQQQARGIYSFTIDEIKSKFQTSPKALVQAVQRLRSKGKIAKVRKEFYVIVPPEYSKRGILPVWNFVDDLMKYLQRSYYVGLLNAAAVHGASHQQPQDFYIIIREKPSLRDIKNKKVIIHFSQKKEWDMLDIIERKTDTGYVKVSSAELTALDLVFFLDRIGGLNRLATLLDELAEAIDPAKLVETARRFGQITTVQRLGYMLEKILKHTEKVEPLYEWLKEQQYFPAPLEPGKKLKNRITKNRWRIIKNASPKSDL
ncbi:MAG: type IV toxin-antitoxin system AbiEi family antitoxin [Bacteroidia bacterium]|nr:type IV toxin-antitoxin system AbiEi family antitoxin [Bacteroidia bacterium]